MNHLSVTQRLREPVSGDRDEWQNPLILGIGKLPARCSAWPCPDGRVALAPDCEGNPWLVCLSDKSAWQFHWSPDPQSRPQDFFEVQFDAGQWQTLPVPACWELHGYGTPIYTNYTYPFAANPPRVMDEPPPNYTTYRERNAVGSYRRQLSVPQGWQEGQGRVILHFGGVSSALRVWVNGKWVGYSQDSRLPAEFDITDALHPAGSGQADLLAVEVYRFCSGSYLEDQDMWRLSGIFRDVFIYRTPAVTLWDFYPHAELAEDFSSVCIRLHYSLRAAAAVGLTPVAGSTREGSTLEADAAEPLPAGLLLSLRVFDPAGAEVLCETIRPEGWQGVATAVALQSPLLWSHETPHLYRAVVELLDASGCVLEARGCDLGFRRVEIIDGQFCLNGRALKVKGVNRHESNPQTGYVVSLADMEQDLRLIKQANINFVRTAHYPNDPRWYELCNRHGMLLMDEANVESHGLSYHRRVLPGDDPLWEPMVVDRMRNMVIRDRAHPCVLMWSLGNEAGYGNAFMAMREATLEADPERRPIHYADMNLAADFDSQTYPTVAWLREHLQGRAVRKGEHGELGSPEQHGDYPSGRPFLTNEYAHAHSNALGNFRDYWDLFEAHPQLWGGFIWDWANQTLYKSLPDGRSFEAYGGDFGDEPNSGVFCFNGLVGADRTPQPHYWEAKKVHQYIKISTVADWPTPLQLAVRNCYTFVNLDVFAAFWQLECNGYCIAEGELSLPSIEAGNTAVVALPDLCALASGAAVTDAAAARLGVSLAAQTEGGPITSGGHGLEYFLTISFRLRSPQWWAPAGHTVAWEQFALPAAVFGDVQVKAAGQSAVLPLTVAESAAALGLEPVEDGAAAVVVPLVLECGVTRLDFDPHSGLLCGIHSGGINYLDGVLKPNFWRALTDSDNGWKVGAKMGAWKCAMDNARLCSVEHDHTALGEMLTTRHSLVGSGLDGCSLTLQYLLRRDGRVRIGFELFLAEGAVEPVRVGVQFAVPSRLAQSEWFGRGIQENYIDRCSGAAVSRYRLPSAAWMTHYVRPQENGSRTDIRELILWEDTAGAEASVSTLPEGASSLRPQRGESMDDDGQQRLARLQINAISGLFSASIWPCTQADIEAAAHDYQLPVSDVLTVSLDARMMGVGGDTSWGEPVLDSYRILQKGVVGCAFELRFGKA